MTAENPLVSIIIPCYNQAHFLDDAVDSVLKQTWGNIEVIVVNDGSSDPESQRILKDFSRPKTTVIHQQNKGRCIARNVGIQQARGKYILPLDADDKIAPEYVEKAVSILVKNTEIGIVYCRAHFFGDRQGEWEMGEFRIDTFLLGTSIFSCAMFRKSDWELVGGYDPQLFFSEDHDFWLSLLGLGRKPYQIPDILFFYRRHEASTVSRFIKNVRIHDAEKIRLFSYLIRKHSALYLEHAEILAKLIVLHRKKPSKFKTVKCRFLIKFFTNLSKVSFLRKFFSKKIERLDLKLYKASTRYEL